MLVDRCQRHSAVNVKFLAAELPTTLPRDYELCLYRIAQEALTNIERHAYATEAEVLLDCDGKQLHLRIADNGIGGARKKPGSLGLQNISDRSSAIGASVRWSKPEQYKTGTSLEVHLPLAQPQPASKSDKSITSTAQIN